MNPMPPHVPRRPSSLLSTDFEWADLLVDLSNNRHHPLPTRLPEPHPQMVHEQDGSRLTGHFCLRGAVGADIVIVYEDLATGNRTAFTYYQAELSACNNVALRGALARSAPPWDTESLSRNRPSAARAGRLEEAATAAHAGLAQTAAFFAKAFTDGAAATWTTADLRAWVRLVGCGITDYKTKDRLQAVGVTFSPDEIFALNWMYARHLLSVDDICSWWPYTHEHQMVRDLVDAQVSVADVQPYLGTDLDPFTYQERHKRDRMALIPAACIAEILAARGNGWSAAARLACETQAPDGITGKAWAAVWERFMPAHAASLFVRAEYPIEDAVRLFDREGEACLEAVSTMAALR